MAEPKKRDTKTYEGFSPKIYKDTVGKNTIGYGFNIDDPVIRKFIEPDVLNGVREMMIPEADVVYNKIFANAISDAKKYLGEDVYNSIDPEARKIINDMSYNMGLTKLSQFKKLKKALINKDYSTASDEMKNSNWYKQTKNRGKSLTDKMKSISGKSLLKEVERQTK